MQAYEMNNKATEGLAKKLAVYREANPLQEPPVAKPHDLDTYEDAKNAKDVQGMLKHKLGNYRKRVVNLSNEVYNTLPIKDILKGVDELEVSVQEKVDDVETLLEAQRRRIEKEYKQIGGLVGIRFVAKVQEALSEYEKQIAPIYRLWQMHRRKRESIPLIVMQEICILRIIRI